MPDKRIVNYTALLLLASSVFFICYWTERSSTLQLVSLFSASFAAYMVIIKFAAGMRTHETILWGLGIRLLLIGAIPALSDDYFRFIWDGMLTANGYSPYLFKPLEFTAFTSDFSNELLSNMNSPDYHSVYPPIMQSIFSVCYWLGGDHLFSNILFLRGFIILAELTTMIVLAKMLKLLNVDECNLIYYALNPLVMIELTGNLHTEAFMICTLALTFFWLLRSKNLWSSLGLSLAFLSKIWPLMFLPFVLKKLGVKNSILFTVVFIAMSILGMVLFIDMNDVMAMSQGFDLYFRKFEFNASIYYIARWIGWEYYGYNAIHLIGPLLAMLSVLLLGWLFIRQKQSFNSLFQTVLIAATIHLLFSTTVHPWYVIPLVFYSTLTNGFKYPVFWSGIVVLSYIHYGSNDLLKPWVSLLEYGLLSGVIFIEWRQLRIQFN